MIIDVYTPINIQNESIDIRHIELTKRRKGQPVVFLPGIGGFAESYKWNFEGFYKEKYWPLAVDHIGFGKSGKSKSIVYSFEIFSIAIAEWIKEKKLKNVIIVGNSFGGGVSMGIWDLIPDRISSIVLVSSVGFGRELYWNYRIASLPILNQLIVYLVINKHIPINNSKKSWKSIINNYKDLPEEFLKISDRFKNDHSIRRAYAYILRHMVTFAGQPKNSVYLIYKITQKIKKSKVPVLIIWGKNDRIIPYKHGIVAKEMTNGTLELIDQCGHMPYIEYPEKFNNLIFDFLYDNGISKGISKKVKTKKKKRKVKKN
ncbi:MAG: 2-hydroxy-6-oxo-6-(2'-aminophenyl)hexa-2,4-dienoic acid hydrolase [Candidatus Heimdallarchaeota archaeon LC_2]|nr:MAG: 2-hydroxy-6-oxo-6-(2'-aminophenyl)hexa-2,4-dienoic acid hydrolase [Candidatus Heimdallarchaeota archaeon LC_2]